MDPSTKKPDAVSDARKRTQARRSALAKFDTLRAIRSLKNAEFAEKQAMTLVETIRDAQSELATRSDVERSEAALRGDVERSEAALRSDMEKMETGIRHDMKEMEVGIRHDMKEMETGIRHDMKEMELRLRGEMEARFHKLSWHIFAVAGGATGTITGVLSLVILFATAK